MKKITLIYDNSWNSLHDFIQSMKHITFTEREITREKIIEGFTFLAKIHDVDHRMTIEDNEKRNIEVYRIFHALQKDKTSKRNKKILHDGLMSRYTQVIPSALIRAGLQALIEFGPEWFEINQAKFLAHRHGFNREFGSIQKYFREKYIEVLKKESLEKVSIPTLYGYVQKYPHVVGHA